MCKFTQGKTLAQIWSLTLGAVLALVSVVGFFVEPSLSVTARSAAR